MPGHLEILRGYSGSGKTTVAKNLLRIGAVDVRVSRDDIRAMLTGSTVKTVLSPEMEILVTKIEEAGVRNALRRGETVVVDDTNLRLKFARRWVDVAVQEGADWSVYDVTTDRDTCIDRNGWRADGVPSSVIEDQVRRFPMPWPEVTPSVRKEAFKPYIPDTSLPTAFGFDLDGTLALNLSGRVLPNHMFPISNDTRLTYCRNCRRKQMYDVLSSSPRSALRDKYRRTERRAVASGIPFSITFDDFFAQWESQNGLCFYTDEPMSWGAGRGRNPNNASVDKIRPDVGYVNDNVVFCTNRINTIKHNVTLDEMEKWMPNWYERVVNALRAKGIAVYQVAEGAF